MVNFINAVPLAAIAVTISSPVLAQNVADDNVADVKAPEIIVI